jgi:lysophospholipid acyltransferase (LPLAT)-like uncharacterized protein
MKIRHPLFLRGAGFAAAGLVRLWISTLRYKQIVLDPVADPTVPGQPRRFLYSFWHETLLLPAFRYRRTPTKVLISEHADGELIAQACRHLGLGVVRGSTTRGGAKAVREILNLGGTKHIVVTPDGPRGPRRVVQPGLVYLAARTGLPIVAVGFAYHRCWRLNSWDRFALPWPFSPAVGVLSPPIVVPPDAGKNDMEAWRQAAQEAMDRVTRLAEERAEKERF